MALGTHSTLRAARTTHETAWGKERGPLERPPSTPGPRVQARDGRVFQPFHQRATQRRPRVAGVGAGTPVPQGHAAKTRDLQRHRPFSRFFTARQGNELDREARVTVPLPTTAWSSSAETMPPYSAIEIAAFDAASPLAGTRLAERAAPRDPAAGEVLVRMALAPINPSGAGPPLAPARMGPIAGGRRAGPGRRNRPLKGARPASPHAAPHPRPIPSPPHRRVQPYGGLPRHGKVRPACTWGGPLGAEEERERAAALAGTHKLPPRKAAADPAPPPDPSDGPGTPPPRPKNPPGTFRPCPALTVRGKGPEMSCGGTGF